MRDRRLVVLLLASLGSACASTEVDPREDQERARALIREALGPVEIFDPQAPPLSESEIEATLADGLGLDEALRLALLNSRRLQAGFLALGIARADFVQAGLLRNPSLGVGFLFPSGGGSPKITADFVQSLVDLWELPARQEVAEQLVQQRVYELSRFAGALVVDTKDAYFESVARRELLATARESADLARAVLDAVRLRVQEGVATAIEENLAQSQALDAELVLRSAERESTGAQRRLAALLSLEGDLLPVALVDALPEPGPSEIDREGLVLRSRASRLDLRASEAALLSAEAQLALERRRAMPDVELGVSFERPEGGGSVDALAGPGVAVELPIFDRNQVQVRRAEFRRDELQREHDALAAEIGQEVRAAVDRAAASARVARFVAEELLPQAERGLELARDSYSLGDTTLLAVLESQRAALQARSTRIEALLEAARTGVEVERAAGACREVLETPVRE